MTDRQKSTHPLHLSVSSLSFKAKSFACSSLLSLSVCLCLSSLLSHCVWYMKVSILFLYIFCGTLWFLLSDCPLPCSNPASLFASLLSPLFLAPSSSTRLIPPFSPSSTFLLASSFCAMPQGPPGPQGSPHPQPPPPNSMMGPHSQVMLPSPSFSLFFSVFAICSHLGTLVLSADASCFGIRLSLMLYAAVCQDSHKHAIEKLEQCYILGDVCHFFTEISQSNYVSVVVLYVTSLCWRPKRSPHQDGQPGRPHTLKTPGYVSSDLADPDSVTPNLLLMGPRQVKDSGGTARFCQTTSGHTSDVVMIMDPQLPRGLWPIGKIICNKVSFLLRMAMSVQ